MPRGEAASFSPSVFFLLISLLIVHIIGICLPVHTESGKGRYTFFFLKKLCVKVKMENILFANFVLHLKGPSSETH